MTKHRNIFLEKHQILLELGPKVVPAQDPMIASYLEKHKLVYHRQSTEIIVVIIWEQSTEIMSGQDTEIMYRKDTELVSGQGTEVVTLSQAKCP